MRPLRNYWTSPHFWFFVVYFLLGLRLFSCRRFGFFGFCPQFLFLFLYSLYLFCFLFIFFSPLFSYFLFNNQQIPFKLFFISRQIPDHFGIILKSEQSAALIACKVIKKGIFLA